MKEVDFRFWGKLLFFALVLRVIISAFLYHPDLKWIYSQSIQTSQGIVNTYELGIKNKNPLAYPPPIYILFNSYEKIGGFLFSSSFSDWLSDWSFSQVDNNSKIYRDLVAMKLPIIFVDFLVAFFLALLAPKGTKRLIAVLWLFNPFSIYSIYVFSQFDVIPTLLLLVSLYLLKKDKNFTSYFFLGLASGFKLFPILLLPFWLILDKQTIKNKSISAFVFFLTLLGAVIPVISSSLVLKSIFLSNLTNGVFNLTLGLGEGRELSLFLVVYLFLLIGLLVRSIKNIKIEAIVFIVLTLLLALGSFHPQWALWFMPFLLLLLIQNVVNWKATLGLGISFLAISLLTLDKFVGLGVLKALNNGFDTLESGRWYLDKIGVGLQLHTLFNSLFLALVIVLTIQILRNTKIEELVIKKIKLNKIFSIWILSFAGIFLLAHIPLSFKATYASTAHVNQYERMIIRTGTVISQDFKIFDDNFTRLELRLKNPNLRNSNDLRITVTEKGTQNSRDFTVNGKDIGDDYNLQLNFDKFKDSANKTFNIKIEAAGEIPEESQIILPYDKLAPDYQIFVDGKLIPGSLSFAAYYNSGSYLDNLSYTLKNIQRKI